jgi:hypothetical protein
LACRVREHESESLFSVSESSHSFLHLVGWATPFLNILSSEQSFLVLGELGFLCVVSLVCFSDEPESFLKTLSLLSLILEPVTVHLVHKLTLVECLISVANGQVGEMLVEVRYLGDLS